MGAAFIPRAVLMLLLVSFPCLEGVGQVAINRTSGAIAGKAANTQGGAIAGARIAIIEDSNGINYDTTTDCSGLYQRTNLPAGSYHVRFQAEEFNPETKSSVQVRSSQVTNLDSRLQVSPTWGGPSMIPQSLLPTGAIYGTVIDHSGAIVPARIVVTEKTTGIHQETTTDSQGVYHLYDLPQGKYWLGVEAAELDSGSRQEVIVKPSNVTCSSVRLPEAREVVEVCTTACMIETGAVPVPPDYPGIELQIYAPSNVVIAGSELLLMVTLTNTSTHPIFIHAEKSPGPTFGYQISAFGNCNCPGLLQSRRPLTANGSSGPIYRVAPGEALTDNVRLRTPTDLPWPGAYTIVVERPDTSSEVNCCEEPNDPPLVRSNQIKVAVMAPR